MKAREWDASERRFPAPARRAVGALAHQTGAKSIVTPRLATLFDDCIARLAPCPWEASAAMNPSAVELRRVSHKRPLYTEAERRRRDATPWTLVQAILAPLQFLVFGASLALMTRYLMTGQGYGLATASILVKTTLLYAIMITGSIWEKVVFGKWLFATSFFWEDACSIVVLILQTTYLLVLLIGLGSPRQQMLIAMAAYAVYIVNASQFLLKLRAARIEAAGRSESPTGPMGQIA
jgi:3-vinyl bacteriochlorophyllide hydratase